MNNHLLNRLASAWQICTQEQRLARDHLCRAIIRKCTDLANKHMEDPALNTSSSCSSLSSSFDPARYNSNHPEYKVNNAITRKWYNHFVNAFLALWEKELKNDNRFSLAEKAYIAYKVRHHARIVAREHMSDLAGLQSIQQRDKEKYNSTDGPSFDWLISHHLERHLGKIYHHEYSDAMYHSIIQSSTRTSKLYNSLDYLC